MPAKKTTKVKPLTPLEKAERKIENLEYAIWQHYKDTDELFAQLTVFKAYLETEEFNKYVAKNYINGIFTTAISHQGNLMDQAGLEY